jgi:hypothetical protein
MLMQAINFKKASWLVKLEPLNAGDQESLARSREQSGRRSQSYTTSTSRGHHARQPHDEQHES